MSTLRFNHRDPEHFDISLDGKHLGSYNHDTDGWAGMEAIERLALNFAEAFDLEVVHTYDDSNEE